VDEQGDFKRQLEAARETVAAQALQIHQLEQDLGRRSGLEVLSELLEQSEVVAALVGDAPYRVLLQGIVQAAARLFDAGAASIALIDHDANELVFEAASGDQDVVGMRFPAHQGIAGWVVMTGEPMAVSDVQRDPRWAQDFAKSTGYVPQSILAVPLIVEDEVEGVLEVLDKKSGASFGLDDMDLLGLFARPAAVAVEQARLVSGVGTHLVSELTRMAEQRGETGLAQAATNASLTGNVSMEQTLEIARLIQELGKRGERGRQLAIEILGSLLRYLATA
jgi:GAF domain-containing protein